MASLVVSRNMIKYTDYLGSSQQGKNCFLNQPVLYKPLKQAYFNKKFEETFGLQEKYGDQSQKIKFAQAAMSNMIGGIGYFYGHSLVQSVYQTSPVKYWDGPLFTGVPSRSFFPRGFLWDEGFHNLLISKWNKRLRSG